MGHLVCNLAMAKGMDKVVVGELHKEADGVHQVMDHKAMVVNVVDMALVIQEAMALNSNMDQAMVVLVHGEALQVH